MTQTPNIYMRWLLTVARKRDVDPNSTWTITSVAIAMYTTLPVDGRNPLWQGILATLLAAVSLIGPEPRMVDTGI